MSASFRRLLDDTIAARGFDHPIWADNDKISNRLHGQRAGIRVPELLQGPCSLRHITPPDVPAVIKPVNGCSARGMVPLVPDDGAYRDPRTGEPTTWDQAVARAIADKHTPRNQRLLAIGHPDATRSPWLLEELIRDPDDGGMPADWKGFCFGGRVAVTLHCRRTLTGRLHLQWWDRDWRPLGDICPSSHYTLDDTMTPPRRPDELIAAMERAAGLVDSPFIRVDMYEDAVGLVFGETTPHPTGGTLRFVPEWDRRLGEAWIAAL